SLYGQVFDLSPPGIYWLFRGLVALGADRRHWLVQALTAVLVVAAALLTREVARRVAGPWPAALAGLVCGLALSVPSLDGDLINVEIAALPFFLAALLLAFDGGPRASLASGALFGLALVTRPSFLLDGAALLVPLLGGDRRRPRLCLAGLGLGAVLAAAAG